MKSIGQYIQSFIARFRNDVYLENIPTGTIASGGNLGLDSNNKIVKATEASGDITGVSITTDSGGGSKAEDTGGSADFSILGSNGVGVTNSGTTITATAVAGEIDHDSLNNFVANEHIDWTADQGSTNIHSGNIPTLSNTIHVDAPKYISLYLFYINTSAYWYTPPLYNTHITTSATINGASISAAYQARGANYIATRACKIKKATMVFYQSSTTLSSDIDLEWALVKWTPADDTANTVTLTQMTMTDHDGAYTETDVHTLTFDVTDNAASTLAEKDCIALCARTTSGSSTVRLLLNGHLTYEIELT